MTHRTKYCKIPQNDLIIHLLCNVKGQDKEIDGIQTWLDHGALLFSILTNVF